MITGDPLVKCRGKIFKKHIWVIKREKVRVSYRIFWRLSYPFFARLPCCPCRFILRNATFSGDRECYPVKPFNTILVDRFHFYNMIYSRRILNFPIKKHHIKFSMLFSRLCGNKMKKRSRIFPSRKGESYLFKSIKYPLNSLLSGF